MQREIKFRGEKLKHFIYMEIYRFRNPVRCKDLLRILKFKTGISSEAYLHRILTKLVQEEKIIKTKILGDLREVYYFKND